jgi:hypothetical protein
LRHWYVRVCMRCVPFLLVRPVRLARLRSTVFVRWLWCRSFSYGDTVPFTVVIIRVPPLSSSPCYSFDFFIGVHTPSRTWVFESGSQAQGWLPVLASRDGGFYRGVGALASAPRFTGRHARPRSPSKIEGSLPSAPGRVAPCDGSGPLARSPSSMRPLGLSTGAGYGGEVRSYCFLCVQQGGACVVLGFVCSVGVSIFACLGCLLACCLYPDLSRLLLK